MTQKVIKWELSFLYMTHHHDLFYITMKFHDYIPKGNQVTERTRICIKKHQRGDDSKSNKARALIFVHDTLSWPVLRTCNCEVSSRYSKWYSDFWADTKMFMDGRTDDGQMPGSSLYPPNISVGVGGGGDKNDRKNMEVYPYTSYLVFMYFHCQKNRGF